MDTIRFSSDLPRRFDSPSMADKADIVNRGTFERRAAGNLEEPVFVLHALLAISLGDLQRDGLRCSQPLVSEVPLITTKRLRNRIRECNATIATR